MDAGEFDEEVGKQMWAFCFDWVKVYANKYKTKIKYPETIPDISTPLFVTWLKGPDKDLRGCIGTFAEQKLSKNLREYAIISAFQDTRFDPIDKSELEDLHCNVSLLCNFTPISNPLDWEVGKHGIEIEFKVKGRHHSGTYLPEVAEEQQWDQKTTLESLIQKAGYYGDLDDVLDLIECKTYESKKFSMSYQEYVQFKEQQ